MNRTRAAVVTAAVLAAAGVPADGAAEPLRFVSAFSVDRPTAAAPDAALRGHLEGVAGPVYGGMRGRTLPEPDRVAALDVFVGVRPRLGAVDLDVGYSRRLGDGGGDCCGSVAVGLARELGGRAELGARLRLAPGDETATAEATTTLEITRTMRVEGSLGSRFDGAAPGAAAAVMLDVGATRTLGRSATMQVRYRNASYDPGRAEMSLRLRF